MEPPLDGTRELAWDGTGVRPLRTRLQEARRCLSIP